MTISSVQVWPPSSMESSTLPRGPGQPSNGSLAKMFRINPEIEILVNRRLTPPGQDKPAHGAWSLLINNLLREWLSKGNIHDGPTSGS